MALASSLTGAAVRQGPLLFTAMLRCLRDRATEAVATRTARNDLSTAEIIVRVSRRSRQTPADSSRLRGYFTQGPGNPEQDLCARWEQNNPGRLTGNENARWTRFCYVPPAASEQRDRFSPTTQRTREGFRLCIDTPDYLLAPGPAGFWRVIRAHSRHSSNRASSNGLLKKQTAPAFIARSRIRSWGKAVMKMIGVPWS